MNKLPKLRIFLFFLAVSLIIYSGSLRGSFLFDDQILIVGNDYIKHLKTLPLIFTTQVFQFSSYNVDLGYNYYRPMQNLLSALDYGIFGLNPFGFHLTNVIIHALMAFLMLYLIYRIFSNFPLAFLASILFCVHPLNTEAVCYIAGRSELLVSLFTMLTLVFFIRYVDSKKQYMFFLSLLSLVFALLSREAGFLLFVPFFMLFFSLRSKAGKDSALFQFVSSAGIIVIYIILRITVLQPIRALPESPFNIGYDAVNFLNVLIEYTKLFFYPVNLHILRSIPAAQSLDLMYLAPRMILAASVIAAMALAVKEKKYPLVFGMGWFILVSLYLIKSMYKFSGSVVTLEEHWIYLASVGFFIVVAYFMLNIKKRLVLFGLVLAIVLVSSGMTMANNLHWRNEFDFYDYNLKFIDPKMSLVPRLNYAVALNEAARFEEALIQSRKVLSLDPMNFVAYIQIGDSYRKMKKYDLARDAYKSALKIDFFCWQANQRLRDMAKEEGVPFKDDIDPNLSPVEYKLVSLIRMGDFDQALDILRKELAAKPSAQLYTLAGITLGKIGLNSRAIIAFEEALKLDPKSSQALYNLAVIYERQRLPKKAAEIRKRFDELKKNEGQGS